MRTFPDIPAAAAIQDPRGLKSIGCLYRHTVAVDLLSATAPQLRAGLRRAKRSGRGFVILDGTLIHTDRPFYSGKHRCHDMNLQALADADGNLIWISGAVHGSTHGTKAARIWQLPRLLAEHGLFALADKGYLGLDFDLVVTPFKGKGKPAWQKDTNRRHARLWAPVSVSLPNSRNGACCGNSAATPTGPPRLPEPSPSSTTNSSNQDEKDSLFNRGGICTDRAEGIHPKNPRSWAH